jgi:hypothetical protein
LAPTGECCAIEAVTNWTIDCGGNGAPGPWYARGFAGTVLMSTEELLAVLEAGPMEAAPAQATEPERLPLLAPPDDPEPPAPITPPPSPSAGPSPSEHPVLWRPSPPQAPRPSLGARLHCARHGHDPRPHRPRPNDDIVYRCLRCGTPMTPRESPVR